MLKENVFSVYFADGIRCGHDHDKVLFILNGVTIHCVVVATMAFAGKNNSKQR